jgi:uncharacterized membrane protein/protein-disulfide isomerase
VLRWTLRGLSFVALLVSGLLAWTSLSPDAALAGCGGAGSDCDAVLTSRWATWFGLPVSVPAVAVYAGILAASILIDPRFSPLLRERAWQALILLAVPAAGAGLWFTGLLVFQSDAICPYCLGVHACGLVVAGLVLAGGPIGGSHAEQRWIHVLSTTAGARQAPAKVAVSARTAAELGLIGLVGVAVLVVGQSLTTPPASHRIEEAPEVALEGPPDEPFSFPDVEVPKEESGNPGNGGTPPAMPPEDPTAPGPDELVEPEASPPSGVPPSTGEVEPVGVGNPVEEPSPGADVDPVEPTPPEERPSRQEILVLNDKVRLDTDRYPVLGHPGAEHVVVDLFDYTCKHCRKLHHQLTEARQRYGDRMAVMAVPVPMNTACNDFVTSNHPDHRLACHYAKLALAVWRLDRGKFEELHEWLLGSDALPAWQESVDHAAELVGGKDVLATEFTGEEVRRMVRNNTLLYRWSGAGQIPKVLIGSAVLVGETRTTDELCNILESRLGIRPVQP